MDDDFADSDGVVARPPSVAGSPPSDAADIGDSEAVEIIDLASAEDIQLVEKDPNNPGFSCSRGFTERENLCST